MHLGTPPSLGTDPFSMDQAMAAATTASNIPMIFEHAVEYECCVCRLTKSDSGSPIGLIGTTCLSLCKNNC